jgi:hypothetical protein
LALPGCKNFCPFESENEEPMSFLDFFSHWKNEEEIRKRLLNWSINSLQKTNDGLFMEDFACICICAASRMNGVSGISVSEFFSYLHFHVFGFKGDFSKEMSPSGRLESLSKYFVPFLSVTNQNWPDYMRNISNFRLGNLQRLRNVEQVDFSCEKFSMHSDLISISGECKDWDCAIDVATLEKKVILHIPQHSNLHFIFPEDGYIKGLTRETCGEIFTHSLTHFFFPIFNKIFIYKHISIGQFFIFAYFFCLYA